MLKSNVKVFNGITSGKIRLEILEKFGIRLSTSGWYRLAKLLHFPSGTRMEAAKGLAWTYYTEEEKNQIIELIKAKYSK